MVDSCYICRRTQADLDRLNEEIRAKVYLSYFSNARNQIDEQQTRFIFLQRLKDEEGADPHFQINAKQVFGDPTAYEKLMPWVGALMEISGAAELRSDDTRTIGGLVEGLLAEEHRRSARMEQGLNQLRSRFAAGGRSPFSLETVTHAFPVDWSVDGYPFTWKPAQPGDREPLRQPSRESKATVEVELHICSVCRKLTSGPG
jgi:hypothetical protein